MPNLTMNMLLSSVGDPDPQVPRVLGLPDPDPLVKGIDPDPDPFLFS
jgi:hypothetical protein